MHYHRSGGAVAHRTSARLSVIPGCANPTPCRLRPFTHHLLLFQQVKAAEERAAFGSVRLKAADVIARWLQFVIPHLLGIDEVLQQAGDVQPAVGAADDGPPF